MHFVINIIFIVAATRYTPGLMLSEKNKNLLPDNQKDMSGKIKLQRLGMVYIMCIEGQKLLTKGT